MKPVSKMLQLPDTMGKNLKLVVQNLGYQGVEAFFYGDSTSPNKGSNAQIYTRNALNSGKAPIEPSTELMQAYEEAIEYCLRREGTFSFQRLKEQFFKNIKVKADTQVESDLYNLMAWYAEQDHNSRLMFMGDPAHKIFTTQGQIQSELFLAKNINDNRGMYLALTENDALVAIHEHEVFFQNERGVKDFVLSEEQRQAVIRTLVSDKPTAVIAGAAGSGKSASVGAISRAYMAQGWTVEGLALSWQAAHVLADDTDIKCSAIEGFLRAKEKMVENGQDPFPSDTALLLDEAGQLKADLINRLLFLRNKSKNAVKFIFSGESAQLNPVGGCNALDLITAVIGEDQYSPITQIRRQQNEMHRDIVSLLRNGEVQSAVEKLYAAEILEVFDNEDTLKTQLVDDYMRRVKKEYSTSRNLLSTPLVLTIKNSEVEKLNLKIRNSLINEGMLDVSTTIFVPVRKKDDAGKEYLDEFGFCVGEKLVFTRNFRNLQKMSDTGDAKGFVANRTQGVVTDISGDDLSGYDITLITDAGETVKFNTKSHSKDFSLDVAHNYAMTAYSSQGKTVDEVFFYADKAVDNRYAYVGCSRHRKNLTVYVNKKEFDEKDSMQVADVLQEVAKQWSVSSTAHSALIGGLQKSYELIRTYVEEQKQAITEVDINKIKGVVKNIPANLKDFVNAALNRRSVETVKKTHQQWLDAYENPINIKLEREIVSVSPDTTLEEQVFAKLSRLAPFARTSGLTAQTFAQTFGHIFLEGKRGDLLAVSRDLAGKLQSKYRITDDGRTGVDLTGNNYPFFVLPKDADPAHMWRYKVRIFQNFNDLKNHLNESDGNPDEVLIWGNNHFISKSQENQDILKNVFGVKTEDAIAFVPDLSLSDEDIVQVRYKESWLAKIGTSLSRADVEAKSDEQLASAVNALLSNNDDEWDDNNDYGYHDAGETFTPEPPPDFQDNSYWENCMQNGYIPPMDEECDNDFLYGFPAFTSDMPEHETSAESIASINMEIRQPKQELLIETKPDEIVKEKEVAHIPSKPVQNSIYSPHSALDNLNFEGDDFPLNF